MTLNQAELEAWLIQRSAKNAERKTRLRHEERQAKRLHGTLRSSIKAAVERLQASGWNKESEFQRTTSDGFRARGTTRLVHLIGDPIEFPFTDMPPNGIYLGEDGRLYHANFWMWHEPDLNMAAFDELQYRSLTDVEMVRKLINAVDGL